MSDVNNVKTLSQSFVVGALLTGGDAVWYWPPTGSTWTVTEQAALSGEATDVAAGGHTLGYQHWCAVVEHVKVECWGVSSVPRLHPTESSGCKNAQTCEKDLASVHKLLTRLSLLPLHSSTTIMVSFVGSDGGI